MNRFNEKLSETIKFITTTNFEPTENNMILTYFHIQK